MQLSPWNEDAHRRMYLKTLFFAVSFATQFTPIGRLHNLHIKSSLYSPHYAEACNELRGPSPRLSAWATQLRRNIATVVSRWRHCADLTGPGIEPQTSRTESVCFATELTAGSIYTFLLLLFGNMRCKSFNLHIFTFIIWQHAMQKFLIILELRCHVNRVIYYVINEKL